MLRMLHYFLLLGYIQVFLNPEVLVFLPDYFPHILSISRKLYLFSWEIIDSSIFVFASQGLNGRVEVSSFHAILNSQYMCMALVIFSETCCTAAYSHLYI